jgi:hypothetical protein
MAKSLAQRIRDVQQRKLKAYELRPYTYELGLLLARLRDHPASAAAHKLVEQELFGYRAPSTHLHELRLSNRLQALQQSGVTSHDILRGLCEVAALYTEWPSRFEDEEHLIKSLARAVAYAKPAVARRLDTKVSRGNPKGRTGHQRPRHRPVQGADTYVSLTTLFILGRIVHRSVWPYCMGVVRKMLKDRERTEELRRASTHALAFDQLAWCPACSAQVTPSHTPPQLASPRS